MAHIKATLAIIALLFPLAACGVVVDKFDHTRFSLGIEMSIINNTEYSSANVPDLNYFRTYDGGPMVIRSNRPGFNFSVLSQFTRYFGIEVGYGFILKVIGTAQNNNQASNKIQNIYGDMLGFLPVAERVDLICSLGVGMLKSDAFVANVTFTDQDSLNDVKAGVRFGAGASYTVNENWQLRGMARYQKGNNTFLKSNTSIAIGILYLLDMTL